jgi:hypothetical protein
MTFHLTERHIGTGLSDEELSAYAGFPVVSLGLAALPHWAGLAEGGQLGTKAARQRGEALFRRLQQEGFATRGEGYSRDEAMAYAAQLSPVMLTIDTRLAFYPDQEQITAHFAHLCAGRPEAAEQRLSVYDERVSKDEDRPVVVPGTLSEYIPAYALRCPVQALYLREPPGEDAAVAWARETELPKARLVTIPDDGCAGLWSDLHEARHLRQLDLLQKGGDDAVNDYYGELDADLFAARVLVQAGLGAKTLEARRHVRFLDLLGSDKDHWIAPAYSALLDGGTLPDCYAVWRAVGEVRVRLGRALQGLDGAAGASEALQAGVGAVERHPGFEAQEPPEGLGDDLAAFKELFRAEAARDPARSFRLLRELEAAGAFQEPLAASVARSIVDAAVFFASPSFLLPEKGPDRPKSPLASSSAQGQKDVPTVK